VADAKNGTSVSEIKKLEADLAQRKEATKTSIVAQISDLILSLKELGFFYTFAEAPKIGRPKKGADDGLA
jgi:hypothetical protein